MNVGLCGRPWVTAIQIQSWISNSTVGTSNTKTNSSNTVICKMFSLNSINGSWNEFEHVYFCEICTMRLCYVPPLCDCKCFCSATTTLLPSSALQRRIWQSHRICWAKRLRFYRSIYESCCSLMLLCCWHWLAFICNDLWRVWTRITFHCLLYFTLLISAFLHNDSGNIF